MRVGKVVAAFEGERRSSKERRQGRQLVGDFPALDSFLVLQVLAGDARANEQVPLLG